MLRARARWIAAIVSAASVSASSACGGGSSAPPDGSIDGGAVQMNDVSILFPLTGAPSDYLAASASGARGVLLPPALYDAVGHIAGSGGIVTPGGTGDAEYGDLHVVALRIDPCFASLAPDPHGDGCKNQLRLIFQEVKGDAGSAQTFDSGLHVFYALSRDDLRALVHDIGGLRAASAGTDRLGGLAPHPIIAREGTGGPMATSLRALVLRYAGAQNLTRVTKLSAVNTGFTWDFSGFDVSDATAPAIAPMVIPTASGAESQSFFRGFENDVTIAGQFSPATTSSDGFVALADEATAQGLTPQARQAAFDGLVRVDNPSHDSPDTIDCASCHLATPVSKLLAQPLFSLVEADDAFAFAADGTWVLPSEMGSTLDPNGPFQVHAFSYVGTTPAIK